MAPSRTSQQTHSGMLPQSRTLESTSVDTPRGRNETGRGRPANNRAAGARHGRGEIAEDSTRPQRRHSGAEPSASGAPGPAARPATTHPHVFVLDKHGQPLQPCHPARARQLLRRGRAVVVRHTPFVIRLKDRTVADSEVDGVEIGIDPGAKTTGIAVFTTTTSQQPTDPEAPDADRLGVYGIQPQHRSEQIRDRLALRAALRRRRRTKNLRHRPSRYHNRARPKGSITPSLMHRVVTIRNWVDRLTRWAPVRAVHMERASFDTALIQNPEISGIGYCQGTLYGYELRQYVLAKWDHRCAYCDASGVPLNLDHLRPRARGGSNRVTNLVPACIPCNMAKGPRPVETFLAGKPDRLAKIRAQIRKPLRAAAAMNGTRRVLWESLNATGLTVHVATGGRTKWNRTRNDLPKTHTLDALCVGRMSNVLRHPATVLGVAATGRGQYRRTRSNKYGFNHTKLPRQKLVFGFMTGDLVRAVVTSGKKVGTYVGRVAVRTRGFFNIRTASFLVQNIPHRYCRILQRADGYGYHWRKEFAPPSG